MKTKQTGAWLTGLLLLAPLAALSAADLSVGRDKLPLFSWERVPRYMHIRKDTAFTADEIGKEKKAELVDGYTLMMKDARRILGPEKLMVANVLRARFPDSGMSRLRAFDGSYMEGFEATVDNVPLKDYMAKGIAAFQQAARQGFGPVTFTPVNLPMRPYGWILRTKPARSTGNKPHEAHPGTSSRSAAGSIWDVTRRNARRGQNQARHHLQNHGARSSPPRLDGQWRCGAGQVDSRCRNNDHQRDVH
jgi:hypothetical protein